MRDERWLRAAGFALTSAGALLAAMGTTVVWLSTGLGRDQRGVLDLEFRGLDLVEGVVTLVVAAVTLVGLVLVRRLRGRARVGVAVGLLVCGVVLVALPARVAVRAEDEAVEEIARVVAGSAGVSIEEGTRRVRTDPDLAVWTESSGVTLSIAGGVLVTLGGVTLLRAASRGPSDRLEEEP